jgi:hypothetical protein
MSSQIPREILGWLGSEKFMLSEVSPDHSLRIDARLSGLRRRSYPEVFMKPRILQDAQGCAFQPA